MESVVLEEDEDRHRLDTVLSETGALLCFQEKLQCLGMLIEHRTVKMKKTRAHVILSFSIPST